jgi:hypothetical protein
VDRTRCASWTSEQNRSSRRRTLRDAALVLLFDSPEDEPTAVGLQAAELVPAASGATTSWMASAVPTGDDTAAGPATVMVGAGTTSAAVGMAVEQPTNEELLEDVPEQQAPGLALQALEAGGAGPGVITAAGAGAGAGAGAARLRPGAATSTAAQASRYSNVLVILGCLLGQGEAGPPGSGDFHLSLADLSVPAPFFDSLDFPLPPELTLNGTQLQLNAWAAWDPFTTETETEFEQQADHAVGWVTPPHSETPGATMERLGLIPRSTASGGGGGGDGGGGPPDQPYEPAVAAGLGNASGHSVSRFNSSGSNNDHDNLQLSDRMMGGRSASAASATLDRAPVKSRAEWLTSVISSSREGVGDGGLGLNVSADGVIDRANSAQ